MATGTEVICFGEALWDFTPSGAVPGGASLNVALNLARNGIPARLLTRVGSDRYGRKLIRHLTAQGLDTRLVQVDRKQPTGRVLVDLSDPQEARFDIRSPAAWDFIEHDPDLAPRAIVFGSLATRNAVSCSSLMRLLDRSELKVFDVNLRPPFDDRERIERLLTRADWAKLNETELERIGAWVGLSGDLAGVTAGVADRFQLQGICVTLGGDGALQFQGGRVIRQSGFTVEVVDTVGCGDAFLGTWLAGLLTGRDPRTNLRRACAVAALVATQAGAGTAVSDDRIRALLAST